MLIDGIYRFNVVFKIRSLCDRIDVFFNNDDWLLIGNEDWLLIGLDGTIRLATHQNPAKYEDIDLNGHCEQVYTNCYPQFIRVIKYDKNYHAYACESVDADLPLIDDDLWVLLEQCFQLSEGIKNQNYNQ